jgi:hypothetical protein
VYAAVLLCLYIRERGRRKCAEYNANCRSEELDRRAKLQLTLQGGSIMHGNYHYKSFDGGHHWYAVERSQFGGFHITGDADPEAVQSILALSELMDDVRRNGPIDLSDASRLAKMTDAGFTITTK